MKEALNLIDPITIQIKKKRAFLELSLEISRLEEQVLGRFRIHEELANKPMVFLVHLLEKCDPANIKTIENSKLQRQFGVIYEKLMETISLDIKLSFNAS